MPRTVTETRTVFKLEELTGIARERALDKLARWATDDDFWYESVFEDAKTIAKLMGITIDDINFSGFSSQGDGACFIGSYRYAKGGAKAVKDHAPQDARLHRIATALQDTQRRFGYKITASIVRGRGNHSHSRSVDIEVDGPDTEGHGRNAALLEAFDAVTELLRDFMDWIYRQLEAEYEYRTSEGACIEMAEANEYEWDENGNPA